MKLPLGIKSKMVHCLFSLAVFGNRPNYVQESCIADGDNPQAEPQSARSTQRDTHNTRMATTAVVRRGDRTRSTLLRKVPTHSRSGDVYLRSRTASRDADIVSILRVHEGGEFAWVRTAAGVEGYLKAAYLQPISVIGITGCTRCGKGRVSEALSAALGGVQIVGQDSHWRQQKGVTLPGGKTVMSAGEVSPPLTTT